MCEELCLRTESKSENFVNLGQTLSKIEQYEICRCKK